jgi:hypothetical protein
MLVPLLEADAFQQTGISRVGPQRVEARIHFEPRHAWQTVVDRFVEENDRLVAVEAVVADERYPAARELRRPRGGQEGVPPPSHEECRRPAGISRRRISRQVQRHLGCAQRF